MSRPARIAIPAKGNGGPAPGGCAATPGYFYQNEGITP